MRSKVVTALRLAFHSQYVGPRADAWGDVTPPCAVEPRPEFPQSGFFETRAIFMAFLDSWSRNGWRYFASPEDVQTNESAPVVRLSIEPPRGLPTVPFRCSWGEVQALPVG